jgi:lysyl-tRNA synthetase class 2
MDLELLKERARILRETRAFFDKRDYLELDTPLMSAFLIPESCLEVFQTAYLSPNARPDGSARTKPYWLIPSPEIWMKQIIARHKVSVYQICHCFRNVESIGRWHSPEFTMLEYYTKGYDYKDSIKLSEELVDSLIAASPIKESLEDIRPPFVQMTIAEAFKHYAGFDLYEAVDRGSLSAEATRLGVGAGREENDKLPDSVLYDLIFVALVEPHLPKEHPVALIDYPAFVPCLAEQNKDGKTFQRWEVYMRGIELANCYSEETDPAKIKVFIASEALEKQKTAKVPHKIDENYLSGGLPQCSGVAMGMDRLIMALTGRKTIEGVLPFPMEI